MAELQSYSYFLVIYLLTYVSLSDAIFMWTRPPPAWNQTNPGTANIQTAGIETINGSSNVILKWSYILLDGQGIDFTYFAIGDGFSQPDDIGFVLNGSSFLNDRNDYRARFSISSTNEHGTVVLITVSERENATFQCRIQAGSDTWAYNVRVEVKVPAGITDISGNRTVTPNETVHLNCSATGHPSPRISWIRVSDNSVVTFPLTITGVKDEGAYRCTASNGIGNPASRDVFITVKNYSPINTNLTTSLRVDNTVSVDSNFTLICSAQADPPAKYRFHRGRESLFNTTSGSNHAMFTTSINERINQVNFSCTPFNKHGEGPTEFITVLVKYRPSTSALSTSPSNTTVLRGNTLSLICSTEANPDAHVYQFYFNDAIIGNSTLGVFNVTVEADGVYTCVPINTVGTGHNATVNITAVDASSVKIEKTANTVMEGNNISLFCNASGKPEPTMTWTRVGSLDILSNTPSLTVVNVSRPETPDHMIQYQCTASNGVESPAIAVAKITVLYLPSTSVLTIVPNNTTVLRGNTLSLICSTEANPDAHVYQFYVNGNLICNSSSGVFNITVEADGVYTCVPINTVGTGHNATVNVTAVDGSSVKIEKAVDTVVEGNNVSLFCNASGKPKPTITWIRVGSSEVLSYASSLTVMNVSRPGTPDHMIQYLCTAFNGVESPAIAVANITVFYLPSTSVLTIVPNNTTVLRGNTVSLICNTEANPDAHVYQFYVNSNLIGNSTSGVFNVTIEADGVYTCVPINTVGTGHNATVNITAVDASSLEIIQTEDTVIEGKNISLLCNASGKPEPTITWTRVDSLGVLSKTPSLTIVNVSRPGTPDNMIRYQCTARNGVGRPALAFSNITVHYRPSTSALTTVPNNTTVLRGNTLSLICSTEANPDAHVYQFYFYDTIIGDSSSGALNVTVEEDGVYTCVPFNIIGTGDNASVSVTAVVPPSVNVYPASATVIKGNSITLSCNASGKPEPSIYWTKVGASDQELSQSSSLTVNLGRPENADNMIRYQCAASNGVESPAVDTADITVRYSPEITKPQTATWKIMAGASVSIECLAKGNPSPQYVWTSNAASGTVTTDRYLILRDVNDSHGGIYTCTALNSLGSDSFVMLVKVTREKLQLEVTVVEKNGAKATYQPDYENINSAPANAFAESFTKEVNKVYQNKTSFNRVQVTALREGSVIVSFILFFTTPVTTNEGIFELKDAVDKGTIGPYTVGVLKIVQHRDPTTVATITSTAPLPRGENTTKASPGNTESRSSHDTILVGILVGIIGFLVIIIILLVVCCCKRKTAAANEERPKNKGQPNDEGSYDNLEMGEMESTRDSLSNSNQEETLPRFRNMDPQKTTRSRSSPKDQSITQPQSSAQGADCTPDHPSTRSWEVARNQVNIEEIIGTGSFGQVAKGTAMNLWGRKKTTVAVKMLKETAPESDRKDLLSELEVMKTLEAHEHVIKLLGCVTKSEPLLVLIEYVPYGDLLGSLRKSRGLNDTYYKDPNMKPQTNLTSQQLMEFAWQIANGMSYLSSRSIIHRDLAARNVLVGEGEICKVTDFGMARDVHQENDIYEKKTTGRRLPVKWTAYEALFRGTYTTKSDVWSFGVVLYETFTIGGSPYPGISNAEVKNSLKRGYRMPKPEHVDKELYEIMLNCWKHEPEERPSFDVLKKQLKDKENQHMRLINMHIYENESYEVVDD